MEGSKFKISSIFKSSFLYFGIAILLILWSRQVDQYSDGTGLVLLGLFFCMVGIFSSIQFHPLRLWYLYIYFAFVLIEYIAIFNLGVFTYSYMEDFFIVFTIIISLILFGKMKYYSFELFKNNNHKWPVYFYGSTPLLLIGLMASMMTGFAILVFVPGAFFVIFVVYLSLLPKSYSLKPRLAFFINSLALILLPILLLLVFIYWITHVSF